MRNNKFPLLILIPFFVLFIVFKLVPIGVSVHRSFFDVSDGRFIFEGFENYIDLFSDRMLLKAGLNTVRIFLVYVIIKIPLVLIFGVVIHSMKKLKQTYIGLLYLPALVGMFAYAIIYRYLFTSDGIINSVIYSLFHFKVDWLGNPFTAQSVVAMTLLWSSFGVSLLLVINEVGSIPKEQFEIAKLDGAGFFTITFKVVLPAIKSVMISILILCLIDTIGLVDVPMNLTGGAPDFSTVTLGYYIYIQAFDYWDFSSAATIGIVLFIIVIPSIVIPSIVIPSWLLKINGGNDEKV